VALEDAREQVALLFGARPREVVFTSGGTEAVNTAVWGAVARHAAAVPSDARPRRHVVATAVEHSAVLDACARSDVDTTIVGVDQQGRFDAEEVAAAIRDDTALVTVQLANHEVGTLQPADDVGRLARARGVLVHVDACAAAGQVPVEFRALDADLCSVTAHKLGGPKGIGALLIRRGLRMPPFIVGGAQERARRGGIENVAAAIGFGAAAAEVTRTEGLVARALASVPGVQRFGDPVARLPHMVCLGVEGVEAEPILLGLDQHGIAVHSGSSCSSETFEPSPVLQAMGVDADHSLRASVGWNTTDADIDAFVDAFGPVVERLRGLRTH
jgi:cysteine desulfurase